MREERIKRLEGEKKRKALRMRKPLEIGKIVYARAGQSMKRRGRIGPLTVVDYADGRYGLVDRNGKRLKREFTREQLVQMKTNERRE